jgi:hypothetical protein
VGAKWIRWMAVSIAYPLINGIGNPFVDNKPRWANSLSHLQIKRLINIDIGVAAAVAPSEWGDKVNQALCCSLVIAAAH